MTTQVTTGEEKADAREPAEATREDAPAAARVTDESERSATSASDDALPGWLTAALVLGVPAILFTLLPPLSRAGLWDPPELNVADLARRIAVNVFGAGPLALTGADNSMPHLNDLGKPELPFLSIALGFKLFGLHEWAGRVPLAFWGLVGVAATYAFVSRLVDRRAGIYAALVLATTPLYAVQSRTMIGDVVTMAGIAMAFGGLAVGLVDGVGERGVARDRALFAVMGVLGLVVGYYSRGLFLGVMGPLVAVALVYFLILGSGGVAKVDALGHAIGGGAVIAALACAPGVWNAFDHGDKLNLSTTLGGFIRPPGKYPTHDFMLGQIAHAMAPWSAFAPFALGRLFIAPPERTVRATVARATLVVGVMTIFVTQGLLVAKVDAIAFAGPALLAAAAGVALRDYERGAHSSIAVGVGASLLLFLFRHDLKHLPEKAFQVFGVTTGAFPESFKNESTVLWMVLLLAFGVIAFLTFVERGAKRQPFDPAVYVKVLNALRDAWDGLLSLVYFALVAGSSLAGLLVFIGMRTKAKWLPTFPKNVSDYLLNAWWMVALAPLVAVFGLLFACDVWAWAFDRAATKPSWGSFTRGFEPFEELFARLKKKDTDREIRLMELLGLFPLMVLAVPAAVGAGLYLQGTKPAVALALAFPSGIGAFLVIGAIGELVKGSRAAGLMVVGGVLAAGVGGYYYPALANQLSPKEVFESYAKVRKADEPLGLFGVGSRTAAYYAGGQPPAFNDAQGAYDWLATGGDDSRRFIAMRADELGRLNKIYREHTRANVPVLDARSSQIILVASRLAPNEKSQNPFEKLVLATAPRPQKPLAANMDDKLEVLGYDLVDQNGRLADFVTPGHKFSLRTYYKVLAPITSEWESFIHIDGFQRRHNGDHKIMQGKYPFSLWLKDDVMIDVHEFTLEPNFTPGNYTIYFGLFLGETRMKVKSGPNDGDNRVVGGALRVQ